MVWFTHTTTTLMPWYEHIQGDDVMARLNEMIQRLPSIWKGDVNKTVIDAYAKVATEHDAGLVVINTELLDVNDDGSISYDHQKSSIPTYVISRPVVNDTSVYQNIDKTLSISVSANSLLAVKQNVKIHAVINEYGMVADSSFSDNNEHIVSFTFNEILDYNKILKVSLQGVDTLDNKSEQVTVSLIIKPKIITPTILSPVNNSVILTDTVTVVGSDFSVVATVGEQTFDSSDLLVTDQSGTQLATKNYTADKTNCILNKSDVFTTALTGSIYRAQLTTINSLSSVVAFFSAMKSNVRSDYCIDSVGTIRKADASSNLLSWSEVSTDSLFTGSYDVYDIVNLDGGIDNTYMLLRKSTNDISEVHLYKFSYTTNLFTKVTTVPLPEQVRHIGKLLTDTVNRYVVLTGISDTICILNMTDFTIIVSKSITADIVANDGKLATEKDIHMFHYTYNAEANFFRLYVYGSLLYAVLIFTGTELTTEYGNINLGQPWLMLSSSTQMVVKDNVIYATSITNNPDTQSTFYENKIFTTEVSTALAGQCTGFVWSQHSSSVLNAPSQYAYIAIQRLMYIGSYFIGTLEVYENNIAYTIGYVISTNGTDYVFCQSQKQLNTAIVIQPAVKADTSIVFGNDAIKLLSAHSPIVLKLRYNSLTAGSSFYSDPVTISFN